MSTCALLCSMFYFQGEGGREGDSLMQHMHAIRVGPTQAALSVGQKRVRAGVVGGKKVQVG